MLLFLLVSYVLADKTTDDRVNIMWLNHKEGYISQYIVVAGGVATMNCETMELLDVYEGITEHGNKLQVDFNNLCSQVNDIIKANYTAYTKGEDYAFVPLDTSNYNTRYLIGYFNNMLNGNYTNTLCETLVRPISEVCFGFGCNPTVKYETYKQAVDRLCSTFKNAIYYRENDYDMRFKRLNNQISKLQTGIDTNTYNINDLSSMYNSTQQQIDVIENDVGKLQQEHEDVASQVGKLQQEHDNVASQVGKLQVRLVNSNKNTKMLAIV